jgi:hypothetical protein
MATAVPTAANWPLPALIVMWLGAPATVVIVGDVPLTAGLELDAVTVKLVPAVVAAVTVLVALPFESVVTGLGPVTVPPPVVVNVTETPEDPAELPYWSLSWASTVTWLPAAGE